MPLHHPPASRRPIARLHSPRAGMTFLEVTISMVVLLVAVGGTLASLSSFAALSRSTREVALANLEAQKLIETMQVQDFEDLFAMYNETTADDPAGKESPGASFQVSGAADDVVAAASPFEAWPGTRSVLAAQSNHYAYGEPKKTDSEAVVMLGEVAFPVDPGDPTRLLENVDGFTFDLDGNGVIDDQDHSGDYALLPVRVRIEWTGRTGNHVVQLETVLSRR